MAILTKFLKLLKPEKNDYVDVEKHLSENYDKIDTKMEELSNSNDKKLDKGTVSTEYDTAKKIEDKIKGINEKFKNFCPFAIGQVIELANTTNPASIWLGTTWQEITDAFTKSVSSNESVGQYAGSHTVTLTKDNLPNTTITSNPVSASIDNHYHYIANNDNTTNLLSASNIFSKTRHDGNYDSYNLSGSGTSATLGKTSNSGSGNTGTMSITMQLGKGTAINIKPRHYLVKKWQRLT